jgi:bifunctional non-homologous end joining protein LigD
MAGKVAGSSRASAPALFVALVTTKNLGRGAAIWQSFFPSPDHSRMLRRPILEPCLPPPAKQPPAGPGWIHEIKHDGFRVLARRDGRGVRLFSRNGYNLTARFPKIAAAVASLAVRSCVIDGEAIVVDRHGLSVFDALRYRLRDHAAVLCAFDLIELDGEDLRWARLEDRKHTLADLLRGTDDGIAFNRHFDGDGEIIFRHAWVPQTQGCSTSSCGPGRVSRRFQMGGFQCQSVSAATLARHVSGANQADDCELLMGTSRCPSTGRTPLGRQRTFRRSPDNMLQAKKIGNLSLVLARTW